MSPSSEADHHRSASPANSGLTALVRVETLQKLQDRFTALGKVTVCICDVKGNLIARPSWGSRYSELIGSSLRGKAEFLVAVRVAALGVDRAVAAECGEGMTVRATAITHEGERLAVIAVGTRAPEAPSARVLRAIAEKYEVDAAALRADVAFIDPYSGGAPEAILGFADVLAETIATLYGQAVRIERQLADLTAVHGLAELLAGSRDLQEILDLTVRKVVEAMEVKACGIRLLDEESGELVIKAVCNLSEEYLSKGPVMLHESPIDGEAFAGRTVYISDAAGDPRLRYPANARREGIVSGLCVPMTYRGTTVGVIRVYTSSRHVFTTSEESLLRSIGSQAASAIVNSRLFAEQAAAERVRRQMEAAGEIQRRMLPAQVPSLPGLQFGCAYVPTLELGGDFYDFITLSRGALGVCIADVVGKGLPAALMMASVRSALRADVGGTEDLKDAVARVNRHMHRDTLPGEFASLFYGVFSLDGRTLDYCNAGHTPPLLLRGDDVVELLAGGLVIGVSPVAEYDRASVSLRAADVVVMTTDGVTEAMNFDGETFGRGRLIDSIKRHRALDADQLAKQILWDVRRFAGLAKQSDDITIVTARVL